jgi:2-oxoglutarate dehydrogenase E2 component (dihydrolipoamide succinyltransferase)
MGFISPVVARIAAERGIDLTMVHGTGQGGRITKKDVLAFSEGAPVAAVDQPAGKPSGQGGPVAAPWEEPASGELFRPTEEVFGTAVPAGQSTPSRVPGTSKAAAATPSAGPSSPQSGELIKLDAVRSRIAEHMVRSKHTSPHVTTVMEADMGRVIAHRAANKASFERDGANLTFTAYFVAAAVEALKAVPIVNSSWTDDGVLLHKQVNIGVAVSLGDRGLIVPVVKNVDQLSLLAIARSVNDLAERARGRELQPDEVQGGTFTITNHGVSGSLMAMPIINQPQCAILGVGVMQKRAVVVDAAGSTGVTADTIAIRPMVYLTLTFDHRIIDGAIGDHFLAALVQRLQSWD